MESLEERLMHLDDRQIRDTLVQNIESMQRYRAADTRNPYYKYELQDAIAGLMERYATTGFNFTGSLNHINKDELKRVYYGLKTMPRSAPDGIGEIISHLSDWEKVCFFCGTFRDRKPIGHSDTMVEVVQRYVKSGYDWIHSQHMIKFNKGLYKRPLKIPHSQFHKQGYEPDYVRQFESLLSKEDGTYETEERTAIFLDSCSDTQLKKLTSRYGREALGGYARPAASTA